MRFLFHQFLQLRGNVTEFFEFILTSVFRKRNVDGARKPRHWFLRLTLLPWTIFRALFLTLVAIVSFPFSRIFKMNREGRINLYWGLPSVIGFSIVTAVVIASFINGNSVETRYQNKMQSAIRLKDFKQAKLLCSRLMTGSANPDPDILLTYADLLDKTGETGRAESIIQKLAPDETVGNAKAHRMRAMQIAKMTDRGNDPELMRKLRWHLEKSGATTTPELNQIWAAYYIAVGQTGLAAEHWEKAAKEDPRFLLSLADLYTKLGNSSGVTRTLRDAKNYFENAIKNDPFNTESRLTLAAIYMRQEKFEDAERVLQDGRRLQPDARINRATAEYFVLQHDRKVSEGRSVGEQLAMLQKALSIDMNCVPIYQRLITQFRRGAPESETGIESMLTSTIARGESTALAHFALSNVYWLQGKSSEADRELLQAYKQDSSFAVIANNLAWMLATREPPELEQALEIITAVLKNEPGVAQFRDTYATILMKLGEHEQAIAEFEKALPGLTDRTTVHQNLARLYRQIGHAAMATEHEKLAEESKKE